MLKNNSERKCIKFCFFKKDKIFIYIKKYTQLLQIRFNSRIRLNPKNKRENKQNNQEKPKKINKAYKIMLKVN